MPAIKRFIWNPFLMALTKCRSLQLCGKKIQIPIKWGHFLIAFLNVSNHEKALKTIPVCFSVNVISRLTDYVESSFWCQNVGFVKTANWKRFDIKCVSRLCFFGVFFRQKIIELQVLITEIVFTLINHIVWGASRLSWTCHVHVTLGKNMGFRCFF